MQREVFGLRRAIRYLKADRAIAPPGQERVAARSKKKAAKHPKPAQTGWWFRF